MFVVSNTPDGAPVTTLEAPSADASDATRPGPRRSLLGAGLTVVGLAVYALSAQLATNEVVVKPGDTLTKIANDYHVSVESFASYNSIEDPNLIAAGRVLAVPSATGDVRHQVSLGESVTSIATTYNSTAAKIIARNNLTNPNLIRIGQVLIVPRPGPVVTTTIVPTTTVVRVATPVTLAPARASAPTAATSAVASTTTTTVAVRTTMGTPTPTPPPGTIPRVTVPSGGVVSMMWVVQSGDTIQSIADKFSLSLRRLASANALNEGDALIPGQRIYVPQS